MIGPVRSPQTPRIVGRFASLADLQERIGPFRLDRVECCVLASARADCVTQLRVASSHQRGQRLPLHPDSLRRRSSRSGTPGRDHLVLGVATSNVGAVSAVVHSLAGDRGEQNTSVHNRTKETHGENSAEQTVRLVRVCPPLGIFGEIWAELLVQICSFVVRGNSLPARFAISLLFKF